MFRTKVSVDRHRDEIFRKIKDEKERSLRCYNLAKLYFQVGHYESARQYVSEYLKIKEESPSAHKLLGQTYEALGQKESALNQYKQSLQLDGRQDDLVVKVCELLTDGDVSVDANSINYWLDRAVEKFPYHPVVFQLKEKMITNNTSFLDGDLEALIISEISARPSDVNLRVKLIKYYVSKRRMEDAYKHAVGVECTYAHHQSLTWYECLYDLLAKMKECKNLKWSFWVFLVTASERYAALSLTEYGDKAKSIAEAAQVLFNFDQVLHEAKSKVEAAKDANLAEQMFNHMWGQLNYHLACLWLRSARKELTNWRETVRLCCPLLLTAIHSAVIDPEASWIPMMKGQASLWYKEGSYRCSQAGHVLAEYCKDHSKRLIDKIGGCMTNSWRENIFRKIFIGKYHELIKSSYFVQNSVSNPPLRLLSTTELKGFDEVAKQVHPDSLHHHVWLGIVHKNVKREIDDEPYPNEHTTVFPGLQLSVYNLAQAAPDSIGILDLDAFLNTTILCSLKFSSDQAKGGLLNPERMRVLPADLTNPLCSTVQAKWWSSAYKIYKRQELIGDIGEMRQELQRGLETVRCIGTHGLHFNILVHLSRIFNFRAKILKEKEENYQDLIFNLTRAELYWSAAIPLLERLLNNQQIRMMPNKIFDYQGKEMNPIELNEVLEEGQLVISQKYIREKKYEQAINVLLDLKCPEASYYQGDIYEKLAEELIEPFPKDSVTTVIKNQYSIMLTKAKSCYYLTLDRLRSPATNPNHPLNAEIGSKIANVEDQIWKTSNKNEVDVSDESFTSANSLVETPINSTMNHRNSMTPQKNYRVTKNTSTPRLHHLDIDARRSIVQMEARPSPERLDAQIRQLMYAKDTVNHTVMDQLTTLMEHCKFLVDSNKQLVEANEELRKEFSELRSEVASKRRTQFVGANLIEDDQSYIYKQDYSDIGYNVANSTPAVPPVTPAAPTIPSHIPGTIFPPRPSYSSLVYQTTPQHGGFYQGLPYTDYTQQSLQSFYPPSVYQIPSLYPRATEQALGVPRMPEMLQQGMITPNIFNSRSMTMFPDLVSPQQQQQQLSLQAQNLDMNRSIGATIPGTGAAIPAGTMPSAVIPGVITSVQPSTTIKNTLVNKTPPVNVVITSSDTLPTNVPSVQPILSVVIPPHHRNVSTVTANNIQPTVTTSAAHNYQILMPSQPTIPTTVNIPSIFNPVANAAVSRSPAVADKSAQNISIMSNASYNSSIDVEVEHDPIPDFVPVIPLPAEVKVTTGEEDEEELFCARAKLFRFVEKEWKERGVGNVKLLKNKEGKVRLLMRRDQVLKICANHLLIPDMELSAMPNNDKAWIWAANDFADEEVRLEKLCIKFKLIEEAQSFKESFDKAKKSVPTDLKVTHESKKTEKSLPEPGKPEVKSSSVKMGGFSFSSTPVIQPPASTDGAKPKQSEEPAKPSPFAAFTFNKTEPVGASSTPFSGFSIIKTTSSDTKLSSFNTTTETPAPSVTDTSSITKPPLRRPHSISSPTPGLNISGLINDDEEAVLLEKHVCLMRSIRDSKQWKDRGFGSLMLVLDIKTGQLRLRFRKKASPASKLLLDLTINKNNFFEAVNTTPNIICWVSSNVTTSGKTENYAASFNDASGAAEMTEKINMLQKLMVADKIPFGNINRKRKTVTVTTEFNQVTSTPSTTSAKPLLEVFKPAPGSWECGSCYTRNNAGVSSCVACLAPSASPAPSAAPVSNKQVPLSQLFKPPADSWECTGCYTRNSQTNKYCVACETPSDPSMPPKPKTNDFGLGLGSGATSTFTFGIPQGTASHAPTIFGGETKVGTVAPGFTFGTSQSTAQAPVSFSEVFKSPNTSFGSGLTPSSTSSFSFGTSGMGFGFKAPVVDAKQPGHDAEAPGDASVDVNQSKSSAEFVFGNTQKLDALSSNFSFGSPGKSFGFQLSSKSPVKSPGGVDVSEDEVAESEDVYFAPVIPLPDKIDIKTGEEDEEVLYKHRAKLFRFDSNTKEWKERGLGDIKLLKHPESLKLRLIMRREQTLKLCLNHFVTKDLEIAPKGDKTWMWNAADYSDGEIECIQLACRFKTPEIAQEFKSAVDSAIADIQADLSTVTDTSLSESPGVDVQVVYELTVSPEEKAAALKLQLPENFYSYKQKEDCPGCLGCREPDVPLFDDSSKAAKSPKTPVSIKLAPPKLTPSPVQTTTTSSSISSSGFSTSSTAPTTTPLTNEMYFGNSTTASKPFSFGTSSIFGAVSQSSTLIFGNSTTVTSGSGDKNFHFGQSGQESNTTKNLFAGNVSVCSPTTTLDFGKSQAFTKSSAGSTQPWIFGGSTGNAPTFSDIGKTETLSTTTSSASRNIFSGAPNTAQLGPAPLASGIAVKPSIFGGSGISGFGTSPATTASSASEGFKFGEKFAAAPNLTFGAVENSTPPTSNLTFGALANSTLPTSKPEVSSKPEAFFNTENVTTFSSLAAKAGEPVGFKTDPNFTFAGAGQSVFGSKVQVAQDTTQKTPKKVQEDEEEEKGANDTNEEYDPHYEPIIPLPDAIEVRTGEEDEEKMFCQRAKLYRYEDETKEWKERGVGEMKVLYHAGQESYRLLLRREQVHKIVCNSLITADLDLQPLTTSDRSWMWVGMNYVDDELVAEKLAIKFKNPALANEFKNAVEEAKLNLRKKHVIIGESKDEENFERSSLYLDDNADSSYYVSEEDAVEKEDVEEEEEEDEHSLMFDRPAMLTFYRSDGSWVSTGNGQLKVLYDADFFGFRVMFVESDGEIICNCIITMESTCQIKQENKLECIWTAVDDAGDPPARIQFETQFSTEEHAEELMGIFQEGLECARQADINESTFFVHRRQS